MACAGVVGPEGTVARTHIQDGALTRHGHLSLISGACFVFKSSISELGLAFSWSKVPLTSFCPQSLSALILIGWVTWLLALLYWSTYLLYYRCMVLCPMLRPC